MKYKDKSLEPVIMFFFWLLCFVIICILGISKVFAASYTGFDYSAQLYDNLGPSLTAVTTSGPTSGTGAYEGYIGYTANSSGGAWGISSPITLISNHTYTLTASIPNECGSIILSSYNRIGVGTTLNEAKISYQNNTNVNEVYSKSIGGNNFLIQFAFTPTINGSYIVFPYATSVSCSSSRTFLEKITIDDLGSTGVSETTINNSLNNQTNELNNSIQNSTDTITGAIDNMEQSIIESNQATADSIIKFNQTCNYNILKDKNWENYSNNTSILITKEYIEIKNNITYNFMTDNDYFYVIYQYDSSKNLLNGILLNSSNSTVSFTDSSIKYIKVSLRKNDWSKISVNDLENINPFMGSEDICINKTDITNQKLDEQNETSKGILGKIKDLFNWLTNNDDADVSSAGDVAGWLPAGPLDSLINLPLTMLNNISSSLNKTCSPLNVNLPYVNKSVEIPCLNTIFNQITGLNSFWTWVGLIGSVLILYRYLVNLYNYYDKLTTLQANFISDWGSI